MILSDFSLPDFLLAEFPIKTGSPEDYRLFIYAPKYLSLIECICTNDLDVFHIDVSKFRKEFTYINVDGIEQYWVFVYHQNNVNFVSESTPNGLLDKAWEWYKNYLEWVDGNLDE